MADRRADERRAALLASLPLAFRRRLALGVFRAIGREPAPDLSTSHPAFEPVFGSLLTGAVRAAGLPGGGPAPGGGDVRWRLAPEGVAATVELRGRTLFVTVSAGWVAEVWAWGIAVVDGWLVLEVVRRCSTDRLRVRAVAPAPPGRAAALRYAWIRRDGARWRLDDAAPAGSSCARRRRASATAFPS